MNKIYSLTIMAVLFLTSCGSSGISKNESFSSNSPEWWGKRSLSEDYYYGYGQASDMGSPTLTQKTATSRAREEAASSINTTVASLLKDYLEKNGMGDYAQTYGLQKYVSENITNQLLSGSAVDQYAESSNKTIYIRVAVSKQEIAQAAIDDLMKNEEIVNKVKADEAFDELHDAMK